MKRRSAAMVLTGLLFWWLVAQANHLLAPLHLTLFPAVLFFLYPALRLSHRVAWLTALVLGAWQDAATPAPAGLHLLCFAAACAVLLQVRGRIVRSHQAPVLVVALLVNLALFLGTSVVQISVSPEPGGAWLRLFADLVWSQLALAALTPWWIALQTSTLRWLGVSELENAAASA